MEELQSLAVSHTPVFRFHSDDAFMPITVEDYVAACDLVCYDSQGKMHQVAGQGVLRVDNLATTCEAFRSAPPSTSWSGPPPRSPVIMGVSSVWQLRPAERVKHGVRPAEVDSVPVYTRIKEFPEEDRIEVTYTTHYSWNGHYRVLGLFLTGHHDADIEHVTIEFRRGPQQGQQQQGQPSQSSQQGQQESPSASGYRPSRMFFAAHTWMEGEWVDFGRVERDRDEPTRPVAYVARHGHGHYPTPGIHTRFFGLGNDRCDGKGPEWRPVPLILPVLGQEPPAGSRFDFLRYRGSWGRGKNGGKGGIPSMSAQNWFYRESHVSTTPMKRALHPVSNYTGILRGPPASMRAMVAAALATAFREEVGPGTEAQGVGL